MHTKPSAELRDPTNRLYRIVAAVGVFLAWYWRRRLKVVGEPLPQGPCVVVANHLSYADPPLLVLVLRQLGRLPRFLAAAELFHHPVLGFFLRSFKHIPVRRGTLAAADALTEGSAGLRLGELIALFPEGGISQPEDGLLAPNRTGAARLALEAGCPVVPVAIWGTDVLCPPGSLAAKLKALLRGHPLRVEVGRPVDLSGLTSDDVRAATARIEDDLRSLVSLNKQ